MPRVYRLAIRRLSWLAAVLAAFAVAPALGQKGDAASRSALIGERLKSAYPDFVARVDGNDLVFKDGTRFAIDDGLAEKSHDEWLAHPDIKDMFRYAYPAGGPLAPPAENFDPGRARNEALFARMYGDCRRGGVTPSLETITWLPKSRRQRIKVTRVNGVARRLEAVGAELEALPVRLRHYLEPAGGTYVCRPIAGTAQRSAHGYGIAIDVAVGPSYYWRWAKGGPNGPVRYRNALPKEIVAIFEKHGFIWGGRWYHLRHDAFRVSAGARRPKREVTQPRSYSCIPAAPALHASLRADCAPVPAAPTMRHCRDRRLDPRGSGDRLDRCAGALMQRRRGDVPVGTALAQSGPQGSADEERHRCVRLRQSRVAPSATAWSKSAPHARLADRRRGCYDPRFGVAPGPRPIPALGDRLMVGLQTLTLPV